MRCSPCGLFHGTDSLTHHRAGRVSHGILGSFFWSCSLGLVGTNVSQSVSGNTEGRAASEGPFCLTRAF